MGIICRIAVLLLGCCLLPVPGGGRAAADEEPFYLQSVQADFVQRKHLQILVQPLVSTGSFAFQVPQSLRWEYREPIRSVLVMHDGSARKYVERDGRWEEDRGASVGALQFVLAEMSDWLAGRFTDEGLFHVTVVDPRTIRFVPKDQTVAAFICFVEIRVGEQPGLLDSVLIDEGDGAFTEMTFTNRILNPDLPFELFSAP